MKLTAWLAISVVLLVLLTSTTVDLLLNRGTPAVPDAGLIGAITIVLCALAPAVVWGRILERRLLASPASPPPSPAT